MTNHVFISYCGDDETFADDLRKSLENYGLNSWQGGRELAAGMNPGKTLKAAIKDARAVLVVFSPASFNSPNVHVETKEALKVRKQKLKTEPGNHSVYPVIPLMLEGVKPEALSLLFGKDVRGIPVNTGPGGISEAMPVILAALGERKGDASLPILKVQWEPLEELVLELREPSIVKIDNTFRAQAKAELFYYSEIEGKKKVQSDSRFLFTAPLGPIEQNDLSWYLTRYNKWSEDEFIQSAKEFEARLPQWGQMLYDAVMKKECVRNVTGLWANGNSGSARRFTVLADSKMLEGSPPDLQKDADEAATMLLSLPWELLHDGSGFIFQGADGVRVRRSLLNRKSSHRMAIELPIRILLVSPRPEDDYTKYINHRASALPLVSALETLGGLVQLTVLSPPTFPALEEALLKAQKEGAPFHVIHFDGHGAYMNELGGLCFEDPQDVQKIKKRRMQFIEAKALASVFRKHNIPLVFLEACQTAQAELKPEASVAAALLAEGTASVVAMSHTVLVTTSQMFVESFYRELVKGARVGEAMLAGQRRLKGDTCRFKGYSGWELHLQDWFIPVLYQESEDLHLLTSIPSESIREIDRKVLKRRLGFLPEPPAHGFVGRSRDLLALERVLEQKRYTILCSQGGGGKTTLAVELARWLVRSQRFDRGVFVSMENVSDVDGFIDQIGRQLLPNFSVGHYKSTAREEQLFKEVLQLIERQLRDDRTIFVFNNMESILPTEGIPPHFKEETLAAFFQVCSRLMEVAETRMIFTSRKSLPKSFDTQLQEMNISRMLPGDAVELLHNAMTAKSLPPKTLGIKETLADVNALVEAVHGHAGSLVSLAPSVSQKGVHYTLKNLSQALGNK